MYKIKMFLIGLFYHLCDMASLYTAVLAYTLLGLVGGVMQNE